jgi:hypothetical protein
MPEWLLQCCCEYCRRMTSHYFPPFLLLLSVAIMRCPTQCSY